MLTGRIRYLLSPLLRVQTHGRRGTSQGGSHRRDTLQVDGYSGYNRLIVPDRVGSDIRLAYCWAHARRKLVEITRNGSAPIAEDGVKRIGELYRIEAELRGLDPDARLTERQDRSAPLVADMQTWLSHHRARVATKSPLGEALAYIAKYWDGLKLFLTDGRIKIDNNSVERTIRPIALNRKNALFAGHDTGAEYPSGVNRLASSAPQVCALKSASYASEVGRLAEKYHIWPTSAYASCEYRIAQSIAPFQSGSESISMANQPL